MRINWRKIFKEIIFFILFEVIFCGILSIILIFHGPFENIKVAFVTSSMTSWKHQYLARLFLSNKEIQDILNKNKTFENNLENEKKGDISVNDNNFSSSNIKINNISTAKYKGYLMEIDNPSRVSIGTSDNLGQSGMTLSSIVKKYNAVAGINAGGFVDTNMKGNGGCPDGYIIENGKIVYDGGEEKKNSSLNLVGFNRDHILIIGKYTLDEAVSSGITDAVCFSPALIINGKCKITSGDGGWGIAPRTAIGQKKDGTIMLLVIDGRKATSIGATLRDVQDIMLQHGAYNAANLDGGSSSTMYYNKVINSPSDILGERNIPSAFIIK